MRANFTQEPGSNFSSWQKKKKKKKKQGSLLPSNVAAKGKHERPQNTSSVKHVPKLLLWYIRCTALPGGHCIYSTYVVPPITKGLKNRFVSTENKSLCKIFGFIVISHNYFIYYVWYHCKQ